jgi:hypothetical protein
LDLEVQFQAAPGATENQEPHLIFKPHRGPTPNGTRGPTPSRTGGQPQTAPGGQLQVAPGVNFKRHQGSSQTRGQTLPGVNFKRHQGVSFSDTQVEKSEVRNGEWPSCRRAVARRSLSLHTAHRTRFWPYRYITMIIGRCLAIGPESGPMAQVEALDARLHQLAGRRAASSCFEPTSSSRPYQRTGSRYIEQQAASVSRLSMAAASAGRTSSRLTMLSRGSRLAMGPQVLRSGGRNGSASPKVRRSQWVRRGSGVRNGQ